MKIFNLIPIITLFFLNSCGESEETKAAKQKMEVEMAQRKEERQFQFVKLEQNNLENDIYKKFGASVTFDTALFQTTYHFQALLKQNSLVALTDFGITDIEQKDSNYIVSIECGHSKIKKFIKFICSKNQLDKIYPNILQQESIYLYIMDKYLILKMNIVKKVKFKLDIDDEPNSEIELVTSPAFFCKGELIEVYLKPNE